MECYEMLGIKVHALQEDQLIEYVHHAAQANSADQDPKVIGNHNLHSLYLSHHVESMRDFYERADLIHIDGMPIVWLGKLFGHRLNRSHRLTSLDWLPRLFTECERHGYRVFLLGSEPGVAERAADRFRFDHPKLQLGCYHGYFDKSENSLENEDVIERVNQYKPDLVLVGMGMPIQEEWIRCNVHRLRTKLVWSLGAFMDYHAGVKPLPPRWLGRFGLEWLYRLLSEPRRLWRRYILEPWYVVFLLIRTVLRR